MRVKFLTNCGLRDYPHMDASDPWLDGQERELPESLARRVVRMGHGVECETKAELPPSPVVMQAVPPAPQATPPAEPEAGDSEVEEPTDLDEPSEPDEGEPTPRRRRKR